ncbi:MAG TPA: adenylate cyclase regulatory domain-containing protein [Solirubrobacteraceae bacterium]|nr:adenylate cyclase regulatory domain-containing protein [Solirubrobacteraceae bacterium]
MPDWEAEGLLEGLDEDERRERRELLDYLHDECGVPIERLCEGDPALLIAIPAERHVGGEPHHTPRECAEEAGIDLELATRLRRAMGLPVVPPDERSLGDADMESLKLAANYLKAGMPEDDVLAVTRVLGRGLGQAAVVMRRIAMSMALEPGLTELELAQRFGAMAGTLTPSTVPIMEQTLKLHLRQMLAGEVARAAERRDGSLPGAREIAVGFADLVGFTRLGEDVPPEELGAVASRMEDLASDVLTSPVRIVKTIGDAVMYVSEDPAALLGGSVDLSLAADAQGEDFPQLRIGVAAGQAVTREGDWFGRPVNLASRITGIARPSSVVVNEPVKEAVPDDEFTFSFIGARKIKGVPGTTALFRARKLADGGDGETGKG